MPLILASASPQRRAILERLGVSFVVRPVAVRELTEGDPEHVALHNARLKANAASSGGEEVVLGCDTVVVVDRTIHGKPADADAARATLRALGGRTHEVLSGLVLLDEAGERHALARTRVSFRPLDERLIEWYVDTGEWRARAGGYAIQGAGKALVRAVEGDYENVVGLPVAALLDLHPTLLGDG